MLNRVDRINPMKIVLINLCYLFVQLEQYPRLRSENIIRNSICQFVAIFNFRCYFREQSVTRLKDTHAPLILDFFEKIELSCYLKLDFPLSCSFNWGQANQEKGVLPPKSIKSKY